MKKFLLCLILLVFGMVGSASALTIQGELWAPADWAAQHPIPSNVPIFGPTATFTVDALNFDSRIWSGTASYEEFLGGTANSNNLQNLVFGTGADNPNNYDKDDFYTARGDGTLFRFTGTAYFEANMAIEHDDGFHLTLDGTQYDFSQATSPIFSNVGNAAGNYDFTMLYGAWNSYPEVLIAPLSNPVPEPATMLLFGLGLLGLAGVNRKKQ